MVYCPAVAKSNSQNTEDGVVYCPAVAKSNSQNTEDGVVYCPAVAKSNSQNTEDGVVYCPAVAKSNSQNTQDEGEGKDEGQSDVFRALGLRNGRSVFDGGDLRQRHDDTISSDGGEPRVNRYRCCRQWDPQ